MKHSRMIVSFLLVMIALIASLSLAQDTAELPAVTGTASDDAIEFPTELTAGLVALTFENNRTEAPYSPLIVRLNEGVTMDDIIAAENSEDPFEALMMVTFYGGSEIAPGESLSYVTELIAGDYILAEFAEDSAPSRHPFVVVEGEMAEQIAPEADVTLAMVDFAFGVPAQLTAGPLVWHLQNYGQQWHEVAVFKVPETTTALDVRNSLMGMMAEEDSEAEFPYEDAFFWAPSGPDTQSWVTVDLEAGTYVVVCFLPDLSGDFSPHMAHGMVQVFTVE